MAVRDLIKQNIQQEKNYVDYWLYKKEPEQLTCT